MDDQQTQRHEPERPFYYEPPTVPVLPEDLAELPSDQPPLAPPPVSGRKSRNGRRGRWGCFRTTLTIGGMALGLVLVAALIFGTALYNSLSVELQEDMKVLESLEGVENFETTRIRDRNGDLLYEIINEGRRTEVPLDKIPIAMRWATIATEDDTFYTNPGFDPPSIMRAAYQWVTEGEIITGGSTITQQLIRQIVFSYEERNQQTLRRKLKEAALAWILTQQKSKDDILSLYLNEVYYGNLAYGVEAAANVYFDKPATELTIAESAFIAGMVQSPAIYDPYTDFAAAKARQRQVLDLMVLHGYITSQDANNAFNESPLEVSNLASPDVPVIAPHFTVAVRQELANLPGIDPAQIARGGLDITTTLDLRYQRLAEQIVAQRVAEIEAEANLHNAALVAINPNTGEVLAMVGSVDYYNTAIDGNVNVTLSPQQPGSAMKPLTYAAAFEQGWLPSDILWDVPVTYDDPINPYKPDNYDNRFHGPQRLRDALANSYNIPAVLLLKSVTIPGLLEMSSRLGIKSLGDDPSLYGLSLTLGGRDVTPLELATAYSAFANGGYKVTPQLISKVTDLSGNPVYQMPDGKGPQVLEPRIAFLISDILGDNVARTPVMGADSPLKLDFPASVKTGTTNDYRDNWTVGYTQHLTVAVWAGNTDNSQMAPGTSGLTGAAPIWHDYMTAIYNDPALTALLERPDLPPLRSELTPPADLEKRPVCILSSLRDPQPAQDGCPRTRTEWFPVGNAPLSTKPTDVLTPTVAIPINPTTGAPYPSTRQEISSGVSVIGVLPIAALTPEDQLAFFPLPTTSGVKDVAPFGPIYCQVPPQDADVPGLSLQLFIAAPRDPEDAIRARSWAIKAGIPIDPGVPCPPEFILKVKGGGGVIAPIAGVNYRIDNIKAGQGVFGVIPIMGFAQWSPDLVNYYRLDIGAGAQPTSWATLGEIHSDQVAGGQLEVLHADALPPGPYVLRLVLVKIDGNFVEPPFDVPIIILSEPPTPTAQP